MSGSGFAFLALLVVLGLEANLSNAQFSEESYQVDPSVLGNMKHGQQLHGSGNRVPVVINRAHAQVAELMLGSPPQKLTCLLDSGSSDMWLPSKRCQRCQNLNSFDADASSTFVGIRRSVQISYGSGKVVGYSARDTLQIGSMQVQNQPFIIVEDAGLPRRQWDGICGLGWKGLAKLDPTLYESMQRQGLPGMFSIVPTSNAARLVLGEMPTNASMQPSTLKWVPAEQYDPTGGMMGGNGRTFWVVSGGVQIKAPQPVPARFLVDTGTNQVLMVPPKYYQSFIRSLIPSSVFDLLCGNDPRAGVVCDCKIMNEQLRPLRIHLGGHPFVLPVSKMFMKVPAMTGGEMCMLTIQPNELMGGGLGGLGSILGGLLGGLMAPGRRLQETLGQMLGDMLGEDQGAHEPPSGSQVSPSAQAPSASPSAQAPSLEDILGSLGSRQEANKPYGSSRPPSAHTLGGLLGSLGSGPSPSAQAPASDPNEVWMIGGAFLEHFVTIFDFDNARLGFAEPSSVRSSNSYSGLFELKEDIMINHSFSSGLTAVLASAAFGGFVLGSLLGLRSLRSRRVRQDSLLTTPTEDAELALE